MFKPIKTVYLVGPIEHSENPDSDWRYILEELLEQLEIRCINPVTISYLADEGRGIAGNAEYALHLKRGKDWPRFRAFMSKIWGQDKSSVDESDALICWVRNPKEIRELNASVGTHRELMRGQTMFKRLFLVCEAGFERINSHLLDIVLTDGAIFENVGQLVNFLERYNKTGKWKK